MQAKQEYKVIHIGGNGGVVPEGHPFYRVMAGIIEGRVQEVLKKEQKNPTAPPVGETSNF